MDQIPSYGIETRELFSNKCKTIKKMISQAGFRILSSLILLLSLNTLFGRSEKENTFETSPRCIYVVEVNVTTSWILVTSCSAHICSNKNGLSNSRILEKGQVDLRVGK